VEHLRSVLRGLECSLAALSSTLAPSARRGTFGSSFASAAGTAAPGSPKDVLGKAAGSQALQNHSNNRRPTRAGAVHPGPHNGGPPFHIGPADPDRRFFPAQPPTTAPPPPGPAGPMGGGATDALDAAGPSALPQWVECSVELPPPSLMSQP
jgi:hypothetical protein